MSLDVHSVRRYGRQIALPEIGSQGQERLLGAEVALVGDDLAIETSARYLAGAGVLRLRVIARDGRGARPREAAEVAGARVRVAGWPTDGAGWQTALSGSSLIVRSGFDDDAMVRAAVRLAVPVVALRATEDVADILSLRVHGPCPHQDLEVPVRAAAASDGGAAAVLAGTLAAAEALLLLAQPGQSPRARHLRLFLDGRPATAAEIPWAPECVRCGGHGQDAVPP
jgi:hypothetical protein